MFEKDFSQMSFHFVEATISDSSPLLGRTIKEADFRTKYDAGVVTIHRNGQRIKRKIGDIRLRSGDTLLLLAREEFLKNWADSRDFYLVSKIKTKEPQPLYKAYLSLIILAAMILVVAFRDAFPLVAGQKISMLYAAAAAAALMFATKCVTVKEAKNSLELNILLTIVCALGLGSALQVSGAAQVLASLLIKSVKSFGPTGILAAIYLLTTLLYLLQ
jgi:di/tricarboxylate transporter